MIINGNTLILDAVIAEEFVCNLSKCKGACCVQGDSGAPLEEDELPVLESVYKEVEPYLSDKGRATIEQSGVYVVDEEGDLTTPCVDGNKECAYVVFENGITQCAIEKAYNDGKISFKKPISCHLYPIRITRDSNFETLNYDRWDICSAACALGKQLHIPVYKFLKEPLIRKYGEAWYQALETQLK